MHTRAHLNIAKTQGGIALVEALIAVLLFSLGILALVGLQAVMSKNVTQAKLRAEASFLANQLIGQMWVDQSNLSSYVATGGACAITGYANCTNWQAQVRQVLPGGSANVAVNGTVVSVLLSWHLPGEESGSQFQIDADITN